MESKEGEEPPSFFKVVSIHKTGGWGDRGESRALGLPPRSMCALRADRLQPQEVKSRVESSSCTFS